MDGEQKDGPVPIPRPQSEAVEEIGGVLRQAIPVPPPPKREDEWR